MRMLENAKYRHRCREFRCTGCYADTIGKIPEEGWIHSKSVKEQSQLSVDFDPFTASRAMLTPPNRHAPLKTKILPGVYEAPALYAEIPFFCNRKTMFGTCCQLTVSECHMLVFAGVLRVNPHTKNSAFYAGVFWSGGREDYGITAWDRM